MTYLETISVQASVRLGTLRSLLHCYFGPPCFVHQYQQGSFDDTNPNDAL